MLIAFSILAATLLLAGNQAEGFIIPSLGLNKVELHFAKEGEKPRLLWQRNQTLYAITDDEGIEGLEWIVSNLLVTLSPDRHSVLVPSVYYRMGRLELGGAILYNSGKVAELPKFEAPHNDELVLYYGWNGSYPAIVYGDSGLARKTYTNIEGKWVVSRTTPESLRALETPSSFLGLMISGEITFSDSWQCSLMPGRRETMVNVVCLGSRDGLLAAAWHMNITLVDKGTVYSSDSFVGADHILPLSGGRVIGRILMSTKPRSIFDGLWAGPGDPFIDSEVYILDIHRGKKSYLGKGLFGLPVSGEWVSAR